MALRKLFSLLLILLLLLPQAASVQSVGSITYSDLAPILAQRCVMCHTGDAAPLGLQLDSFEAVLKGSTRGPVLIAGDPASSELIRRLKGISQPQMPMTGPPFLSDIEITLFEGWITAGMPRGEEEKIISSAEPVSLLPAPGETVTYLHVAPIFATRCAKCHTDNGVMGAAPEGYRLTSIESTLSTADRVRVVPGNPEASELVRRIRGQSLPRMPFDGPPYLSEDEIRLIEAWVEQGARDVTGNPAPVPTGATVRLQGILQAGWKLDGLELIVSSDTRIDKSPEPGDYIEVRGRIDRNGKVRVERLRHR